MNNLILRIGTSVFILPIFILCIYFSGNFLKLLLLIIFFISIYEINKNFQKNFIYFFLIFLQLIFCLSFYSLRGSTSISLIYLIWLISIVILTDIGGYVFGKLIGGRTFSKISPNKTIAGLCGSLFFSQFSCLIFVMNENFVFNNQIILKQILFSIIAIFGDLFFSFLKRKNSIKDYSNLFPGHGGLLDRIDGMIFVIISAKLLTYV